MDKADIRQTIYAKIDELPTLPDVVPRLLGLMENQNTNTSDITAAISHDPALTAKILKVANSAYYGFPQEISDLERAVALLGFNMVKSLALSIGVIRSLPSKRTSAGFSWKGLWVHSLAVATVMKALGKRGGKGDDPEVLFVIGLLHDIGKIVLNQFFSDLLEKIADECQGLDKAALYDAERHILGLDHAEVGGEVLKRWKFPERISTPISWHHRDGIPEGAVRADIARLGIADILPQQLGFGEEGETMHPPIPPWGLKALGMTEEALEEVRVFLSEAKEGIEAFYTAMS